MHLTVPYKKKAEQFLFLTRMLCLSRFIGEPIARDKRTNEQANKRTNEQSNNRTIEQSNNRTIERTNKRITD
jgi:hypothetical protein